MPPRCPCHSDIARNCAADMTGGPRHRPGHYLHYRNHGSQTNLRHRAATRRRASSASDTRLVSILAGRALIYPPNSADVSGRPRTNSISMSQDMEFSPLAKSPLRHSEAGHRTPNRPRSERAKNPDKAPKIKIIKIIPDSIDCKNDPV